MNNIMLDTNVILDALAERRPFDQAAKEIILLGAKGKIRIWLTANCITDLYYLLRKHYNAAARREILTKIFTLFEILDITGADCKRALECELPDYEDALLAVSSRRGKMDLIITRNEKDFAASPVRVVAPTDFLREYAS